MVVLGQLRFVLYDGFDVALVIQKPLEETFLDLLVVLLFKEVVVHELHRAQDEQFAAFQRHVEGADWSVRGETDGTRTEDGATRFADVESGAVRVDELEAAILIPIVELVLGVAVLSRILASFLFLALGAICGSNLVNYKLHLLYKLLRETAIANKGFLRVEVLVECFPHNAVRVHANANLLQHGVDISLEFGLTTFIHHDHATPTFLNVAAYVLQLLGSEWKSGTSEQEHVVFFQLFER